MVGITRSKVFFFAYTLWVAEGLNEGKGISQLGSWVQGVPWLWLWIRLRGQQCQQVCIRCLI